MRRLTRSIHSAVAISMLGIVSACSSGEMTAHDQTVIYQEVPIFLEAWQTAGNEGRYDDLKAFYSPGTGFTWVEQGKIAYASRQDVAAGLDGAKSAGATTTLKLDSPVFKALARDVASVAANYTLTINFPPDTVIESAGMFTGVVKKEENGWMFVQGHFSAPLPDLSAPAPDPVSVPEPASEPATDEAPTPN